MHRLQRHHSHSHSQKIGFPVTFISGPPGSGKSLVLKMLRRAAAQVPGFIAIDMSDVIKHYRLRPESKLGTIFNRFHEHQKAGELLPNKPIVQAGIKYLMAMNELCGGGIVHCTFGGAVRNRRQAKDVVKHYGNRRLITIDCTPEESLNGVLYRPNGDREDSSDAAVIAKRYHLAMSESKKGEEYFEAHTPPGSVLRLRRSQSLMTKMLMIIGFINIPTDIKRLWLQHAQDQSTPLGREIMLVDHPHAADTGMVSQVAAYCIPANRPAAAAASVSM